MSNKGQLYHLQLFYFRCWQTTVEDFWLLDTVKISLSFTLSHFIIIYTSKWCDFALGFCLNSLQIWNKNSRILIISKFNSFHSQQHAFFVHPGILSRKKWLIRGTQVYLLLDFTIVFWWVESCKHFVGVKYNTQNKWIWNRYLQNTN